MGTKQNKLDELKGQNPFKLPAGYFEGLTEQIMSRLPETPREEAPAISLLDRVRPWLYMAAVFIGLVLLFKGITSGQQSDTREPDTESMFRSVLLGGNMFTASEEDLEYLEYLEYLESEYLSGAFTEELENAE